LLVARIDRLAEDARMMWRILAAQADIAERLGSPEEAEGLRDEAREIVAFIADNAGSEELRASFLASPDANSLLS
jgi:hypothetical protein